MNAQKAHINVLTKLFVRTGMAVTHVSVMKDTSVMASRNVTVSNK